MPPAATTTCSRCGGDKLPGKRCVPCHRKTANAWQQSAAGRSSKRASRSKMWEGLEGRAYDLWRKAKFSSKQRRLEFTITPGDVRDLVATGHCSVTGLPFDLTRREGSRRRPFAPSIDRKDPGKGYTKDNVQIVVWIYNMSKSDWSHDDVLRMAQALVSKNRGHVAGLGASARLVGGLTTCC